RRLHKDAARKPHAVAKCEKLIAPCVTRRVFARGRVRKKRARAKDVAMRIDRPRRRNIGVDSRFRMKGKPVRIHYEAAQSPRPLNIASSRGKTRRALPS